MAICQRRFYISEIVFRIEQDSCEIELNVLNGTVKSYSVGRIKESIDNIPHFCEIMCISIDISNICIIHRDIKIIWAIHIELLKWGRDFSHPPSLLSVLCVSFDFTF